MIQKYFEGEIQKIVFGIRRANANVRGKFESLQTLSLFWIQRLPSCQDLFNWNKG